MTTAVLDAVDNQPDAAAQVAGAMVRRLLDQASTLRGLDRVMYPIQPDEDARRRSRLMFDAWHAWIAEAQALLGRIRAMRKAGRPVEGEAQLFDESENAQLMVQMTLEKIERGREQARRGEGKSGEELRRELGLPPRARRAAKIQRAAGVDAGRGA